jgi:ribosomal protein S27E
MVQLSAGMDASVGAPTYERHRPEKTLLYQLVKEHYPAFVTQLAAEGKVLPDYVHQEFEAYLKCGRLEHGFLRVQCDSCHAEQLVAFSCKRRGFCPSCGARRMAESSALLVDEVLPHRPMRQWVLSVPHPLRYLFASQPKIMGKVLGIMYRTLATHLIHKAGYKKSDAHTGAVTLIQRFGGALNLNIHFHMIFLDGVYVDRGGKLDRFRWVKAPLSAELSQLTHTIAHRIGRYLERQGLLVRDAEHSYLALEASDENPEDSMSQLQGHSITYRIAVGPHQGRKVFTLQTLPGIEEPLVDTPDGVAGFSLHASVAVKVNERKKLERICRYISRPAVSEKRLSLTRQGKVRYQLKTPYRDGTTHVIVEPVDFIAKLAALVPRPRVNLTRYHGVFAPNSTHRALVTPARRGKGGRRNTTQQGQENEQTNPHVAMTWSQRLKRVFNGDAQSSM